MKVYLTDNPFTLGEGYTVYTSYMMKTDLNMDIVKCPAHRLPEDKGKDSFIDFMYDELSESVDFRRFLSFLFVRIPRDYYDKDFVVSVLKRLFYPSNDPEYVSTSHIKFSNGWEGYKFFNNDVCILNTEDVGSTINLFVALPGQINTQDSSCRWNDIVNKHNFYDILKSKMIEELINAEVYG